jgi:hypothetical protein
MRDISIKAEPSEWWVDLCPYAIDAARRSRLLTVSTRDIDRRRHLVLVAGKPRRLTRNFWRLFTLRYRHLGDVVDNDRICAELYDEVDQQLASNAARGKRAPAEKGAGRVEVRDRQPSDPRI